MVKETLKSSLPWWQIIEQYHDLSEDMVRIEHSSDARQTILLPTVYIPISDKTIVVEDCPKSVFKLPQIIQDHHDQIMSFHGQSAVYNNTNIRVDGWRIEGDCFRVRTGRTTYFDTLVTNRAMDYEFANGLSIRRLLEPGPAIHSLESSRLSNHLGVNGFVETEDHSYCFVLRKQTVSFAQGLWGCGVSGSLKYKYSAEDGIVTTGGLVNGVVSEIIDELNLSKVNSPSRQQQSVNFISAYRDLVEGGKPHLLFHAKCPLQKEEIARLFRKSDCSKKGGDRDSDLATIMSTDGRELLWVSRSVLEDPERLKLYPDRFVIDGREYPTSPSYAACVQMLRCYLSAL